jgi:hypothetical protein
MVFATLASLLADFNASRRDGRAATIEEFQSWLAAQRHDQVLGVLMQSQSTLISLKVLLATDRNVLAQKLEALDQHLTLIASQTEGLKALAQAVRPTYQLSDQAISILEQLVRGGVTSFARSGNLMGPELHALNGRGDVRLALQEPNYLVGDIETLCELGLVRFVDTNGNHDPVYQLDRAAAPFLKSLGRG